MLVLNSRAGHATTQPRQRDHAFRPKKMVDYCLMFLFGVAHHSITLPRCRCREAKILSRAQLCLKSTGIIFSPLTQQPYKKDAL